MNEQEMGFRTQIVGGFQRDDVLRYIETTNQVFTARIEALERDLAQARQDAKQESARAGEFSAQAAEFSAKDAEILERLGAMTLSEDSLRSELETVRAELSTQTAAAQRLAAENSSLRAENAAYAEELRELRRKCSEYESAKGHMTEIELRAYRQAKELEAKSQAEAAHVRRECDEMVAKLKRQLNTANDAYRLLLVHAQEDFAAMQKQAGELLSNFEAIGGQLSVPAKASSRARDAVTEVLGCIRGKGED